MLQPVEKRSNLVHELYDDEFFVIKPGFNIAGKWPAAVFCHFLSAMSLVPQPSIQMATSESCAATIVPEVSLDNANCASSVDTGRGVSIYVKMAVAF